MAVGKHTVKKEHNNITVNYLQINILLGHILIKFYSKMAYSNFHVKLLALIAMPLSASRIFNSEVKFLKKKEVVIRYSIHSLSISYRFGVSSIYKTAIVTSDYNDGQSITEPYHTEGKLWMQRLLRKIL